MVTYFSSVDPQGASQRSSQSAGDAKTAGSFARENTRDNVLNAVLSRGPVSATEIAKELNLTPAAVRRHLDALESEGLIEVKLVTGGSGAGRPSKRYVVTQRGQSELGDDYLNVSSEALRLLERLNGEEAIRQLARSHFAGVEKSFLERDTEDSTLNERVRTLTEVLDEHGYAASTTRTGRASRVTTMRAAQICQGHCPIQELTGEFPQFCEEETELFSRLLRVDVRRLATIPTGGHLCTTHVPLGRRGKGNTNVKAASA